MTFSEQVDSDNMLINKIYWGQYPPEAAFRDVDECVAFLNIVWIEIAREYNSGLYGNRTHGNERTYNEGCRGPVCRLGAREANRARKNQVATGRYVWLDKVIAEYDRVMLQIDRHNQDQLQTMRYTGHLIEEVGVLKSSDDVDVNPSLLALLSREAVQNAL